MKDGPPLPSENVVPFSQILTDIQLVHTEGPFGKNEATTALKTRLSIGGVLLPDNIGISIYQPIGQQAYPFVYFSRPVLEGQRHTALDESFGKHQFMRINPANGEIIIDNDLLALDSLSDVSNVDAFQSVLAAIKKKHSMTPEALVKLHNELLLLEQASVIRNRELEIFRTANREHDKLLHDLYIAQPTIQLLGSNDAVTIDRIATFATGSAGRLWQLPLSQLTRAQLNELNGQGVAQTFDASNAVIRFEDMGRTRMLKVISGLPGYMNKAILEAIATQAGNHGNFAVHSHVSMTRDERDLIQAGFPLRRQFLGIPVSGKLTFDAALPDSQIFQIPHVVTDDPENRVYSQSSLAWLPNDKIV